MTQEREPIIQVRNLCYEVSGHRILRDVSFDVYEGEIFGVMGMSGSGKSTLLKILMGLIPACGGDVIIGGRSILGYSEHELMKLRTDMGMCFQYSALFDSMTVADNVAFGLRRRARLSKEEIGTRVTQHLAEVGLHDVESNMPAELSGGMRKRVSIARELILRPKILLYDEPSAGLDPIMSAVIDDVITDLRDRFGITSMVVTHEVEELFAIADRVMMIHGGVVAACDVPEALRETPNDVVEQFVRGSAVGPIRV